MKRIFGVLFIIINLVALSKDLYNINDEYSQVLGERYLEQYKEELQFEVPLKEKVYLIYGEPLDGGRFSNAPKGDSNLKGEGLYKVSLEIEKTKGLNYSLYFIGYSENKEEINKVLKFNQGVSYLNIPDGIKTYRIALRITGSGVLSSGEVSVEKVDNKESEGSELLKNFTHNPYNYGKFLNKFIDGLKKEKIVLRKDVLDYNSQNFWFSTENRSVLRVVHGHFILNDLINLYQETGERFYIDFGADYISRYLKEISYSTHKDTMAFHDEATAARVVNWTKFLDYSKEKIPDGLRKKIEDSLEFQANLLSTEDFYSYRTNHGMFQDLGLLVYSYYFPNDIRSNGYKELALWRLNDYLEWCITSEGVHIEHSPAYHFMMMNYFQKIVSEQENLKLETSFYEKTYKKMLDYATYIIMPNGYLPPIGDTSRKQKPTNLKLKSDEYLYSLTQGKEGKKPNELSKVFPESGYAIFRNNWDFNENSVYVLFTAAYHTNYHKHTDDLSFIVYKNGEIISEAGPAGYHYKDPYNRYAYSAYGHNTLVVNNRSLPRVDGKYNKVKITDYNISENSVTGINTRNSGVAHERTLKFEPKKEVIIVNDSIRGDKRNNYKLYYHLGNDISVEKTPKGNSYFLYRGDEKVAKLQFNGDAEIKSRVLNGQESPYIQGFYYEDFYKKNNTNVIEVEFSAKNAEILSKVELY